MKKTILGIIIGIVVGTTANVIASTMLASQITYTPKDSTWKVNNVEAAIDSLMLSKTETNYSTEEKVVGTWIDGKPLYQKSFKQAINASGTSWVKAGVTIDNLDKLLGYTTLSANNYPSNSAITAIRKNYYGDNTIGILVIDVGLGMQECYITIQYTKTTDQATN